MNIKDYIVAEKSIHNYVRIMGEISDLFIDSTSDYSHTNLAWIPQSKVLQTRNIHLPNGFEASIEYHPNHFHFHISTDCPNIKNPLILTKNNNLNYIINTFQNNLKLIGLEGKNLTDVKLAFPELLHNSLRPMHPSKDAIHLFEKIRTESFQILENYLKKNDLESDIRIWPHNFDTGIFCKHANGIEQFAGYAPADSLSDLPYFYNSFYKDNKAYIFETSEKLKTGKIINEAWKGAIYTLDDPNNVDKFIKNASSFFEQTSNIFLNK